VADDLVARLPVLVLPRPPAVARRPGRPQRRPPLRFPVPVQRELRTHPRGLVRPRRGVQAPARDPARRLRPSWDPRRPLPRPHLFGDGTRGTRTISIPPAAAGPRAWHLAVDGAARSSRFPSAVEAALYEHSCSAATVSGSWWHEGPVPCLLAYTARDLRSGDRLSWDLDARSPGGYTSSHAEARAWRKAGGRTVRCSGNAPRDCPRDRFICIAADPSSGEDSA
jgi:hypothetical protein